MLDERFRFDLTVPPGGYAWWYCDAESSDGEHALTIIAFIGSVFSPYYAWSMRAAPLNHCALNVALYGRKPRWSMTERSRRRVRVAPHRLDIGQSAISWRGGELTIEIAETAAPLPRPIKGIVKIRTGALTDATYALDSQGRHHWRPIAPRAAFDVALSKPSVSWKGNGYVDSNFGVCPLEDDFQSWNWMRLHSERGGSQVFYDVMPREGPPRRIAIDIAVDGTASDRTSPSPVRAKPTPVFQIERLIPAGDRANPSIIKTLEDAPFYSRSLIETTIDGVRRRGFHESLSGDRLKSPHVRAMLPFRMPRHDF